MKTLTVVVIALASTVTSEAHGWNSLGHKVVAEIAWQQLDPSQRQSIVDTLRRHPRFDVDFQAKMEDSAAKGDKATQDHWIFQHAATWPDEIRKNKEYDRPLWHYIDLPLFLDPSDRIALRGKSPVNLSAEFPTSLDEHKYNAIQAIAWSRATLASKAGPDVKAIAYCWLMHLIGDIHQPLHSTALFSADRFRKGDEGGNLIPLAKGKNLHSLWDGLLGKQYYMRNVDKSVAELSNRQRFGDAWDSAAKETDPRRWADESHAFCESVIYDPAILEAVRNTPSGEKIAPINLSPEYYKGAGELARKRIVAAGLRLGAMLKTVNQ
jgi:hypothetical protein